MINWWNNLQTVQQIFALFAIPSTLLLLIQTIMLLVGLGHDSDTDADGDVDAGGADDIDLDGDGIPDSAETSAEFTGDDGLSLFTVRGILSMLCITGWTGVALLETSLPSWAAIAIAIACGLITLFAIAYLMKAISKLQSNGVIDVDNCIGKVAQVYIPIPAAGEGSGKVNVTVQEKYCEFTAITPSATQLRTGSYVRVTGVSEAGVLVVEPLSAGKDK